MATEYLIACILFTIQIIEILRAKILKQILLRLFCRKRVGVKISILPNIQAIANPSRVNARFIREGYFYYWFSQLRIVE